MLNPEP